MACYMHSQVDYDEAEYYMLTITERNYSSSPLLERQDEMLVCPTNHAHIDKQHHCLIQLSPEGDVQWRESSLNHLGCSQPLLLQ